MHFFKPLLLIRVPDSGESSEYQLKNKKTQNSLLLFSGNAGLYQCFFPKWTAPNFNIPILPQRGNSGHSTCVTCLLCCVLVQVEPPFSLVNLKEFLFTLLPSANSRWNHFQNKYKCGISCSFNQTTKKNLKRRDGVFLQCCAEGPRLVLNLQWFYLFILLSEPRALTFLWAIPWNE